MIKRLCFTVLLVSVLISVRLQPANAQDFMFTINVFVVNAVTGAPLAGVFPIAHMEGPAGNWAYVCPSNNGDHGTTDNAGWCGIDVLPAGEWRVVADKVGYRPRTAVVQVGVQYGAIYTVPISLPPVQ